MSYFIEGFRKAFDFKGRASRAQYWVFTLTCALITFLFSLAGYMTMNPKNPGLISGLLFIVFSLWLIILIVPQLAIAVRRMHDLNRSGWWLLINFLPVIGGLWFLILLLLPSVTEGNRFAK